MSAFKLYKNTVGFPIILNAGETITGATDITIEVKKPSGELESWPAAVYGTEQVKYTTLSEGDLDETGNYELQIQLTLGALTGARGATYTMRVYDYFE